MPEGAFFCESFFTNGSVLRASFLENGCSRFLEVNGFFAAVRKNAYRTKSFENRGLPKINLFVYTYYKPDL